MLWRLREASLSSCYFFCRKAQVGLRGESLVFVQEAFWVLGFQVSRGLEASRLYEAEGSGTGFKAYYFGFWDPGFFLAERIGVLGASGEELGA